MLAWPMVGGSADWRWPLTSAELLAEGTINASVISIGEAGVLLAPQRRDEGPRAISVITGALHLSGGSNQAVRVTVSIPSVAFGASVTTRVRLLWQTEPLETYYHVDKSAALGPVPTSIQFELPAPAASLHRLGVQFPDVQTTVVIEAVEVIPLSLGQGVELVVRQAAQREPIVNQSVNFLKGPVILGRGVNYYLVGALLMQIGAYSSWRSWRRKKLDWRWLMTPAVGCWLLGDAWATMNLARQCRDEVRTLAGKEWPQQISAAYGGPPVAWAYETLQRSAGAGKTFAVIREDPFTPAHRLAYFLTPAFRRSDDYDQADYVVVLQAATCEWDAEGVRFRCTKASTEKGGAGWGPWIAAERVAEFAPNVYILRRIRP